MASDRRILFDERLRCLPSGTVALVVEQLWGSTCCWRESWVIINCGLRVLNNIQILQDTAVFVPWQCRGGRVSNNPKLVTYFVK